MVAGTAKQRVEASSARYIKLGSGGEWAHLCFEDGTVRLGYYEVPHASGLEGDTEAIRKVYLDKGVVAQTASNHARQVLDFYRLPVDTIWVTFADGFMWWCFSKPKVEFLGDDVATTRHGSRLRRTVSGWRNTDIEGRLLRTSDLNGRLTSLARFPGTVCDVEPFDYLMRKVNGEDLPETVAAIGAKDTMLDSLQALIKLLPWADFEVLVELIFAQSGWRRTGETGGSQETVDIELDLPTTGERAFVQVKSRTNQRQLDDYVARLSHREEARMFYAYHSGPDELRTTDPRVTLIGLKKLSQMALDAGLCDWLIRKAG